MGLQHLLKPGIMKLESLSTVTKRQTDPHYACTPGRRSPVQPVSLILAIQISTKKKHEHRAPLG